MTSLTRYRPETSATSSISKIAQVTREELGGHSLYVSLAHLLPSCLPAGMGGRLRAAVYRLLGLSIGPRTLIMGPMTLAGGTGFHRRVHIGSRCFINRQVYLDASAPITLGEGVSLGHHVIVITTDHAVGPPSFRAGTVRTAPVTIGDGAWVAAGVTLLPGVTIGAGSVIAAGAVVTKDVPPNMLMGGVPARCIRPL